MKKLIYDIAKKSKILRIIFRNTRDFVNRCKYIFYMIRYRMDDRTILFEVYGGRGYTCSPRSIYEKMITLDKFKAYKCVNLFCNGGDRIIFFICFIYHLYFKTSWFI